MKIDNRLFKVAFAIFAGAFIGSVVSTRLFDSSFWSLLAGLIAGGAVGYLAYDPRQVASGFIKAWTTVKGIELPTAEQVIGELRLQRLRFKLVSRIFRNSLSIGSVLFWPFTALLSCSHDAHGESVSISNTILCVASAILGVSLFISLIALADSGLLVKNLRKLRRLRVCTFADPVAPFRYTNPVSLPFVVLYFALKLVWLAVKWFVMHAPLFTVTLIKLIHCELRVQTAAYAMIGTIIGWRLDSPVIGASAGAVLGTLGYKLVTVRLIKPAAAGS